MRNAVLFVVAIAAVAGLVVVLNQRSEAQEQIIKYENISQDDFKLIDAIAQELFAPMTKGDGEAFGKAFTKHAAPGMTGSDQVQAVIKRYEDMFGKTKAAKYIRHESIERLTDYYAFYYADMREIMLVPWEISFYRVKGEWKIVNIRTESGNPVEFFRFPELQYKGFSK